MTQRGSGISANLFRMIELDFFRSSPSDLVEVSKQKLAGELKEWEKGTYEFVRDWFAPQAHVQAHTSGSTGAPKPILLEKKRMEASAHMTGEFLQLEPGNTALLCLPLKFIAGKMMLVRAMVLRLRILVIEPQSAPLNALTSPIHFSAMVPNQVFNSLRELVKVNTLLIGGGPVDKALADQLQLIPGKIYHTYGMTETMTHVAMRRMNGSKRSSYFEALPGVSFRVDGSECLVIKAPHLLEEELITNDLVELVSPKEFLWKGRYDNVIISGGVKIIPEEVERELGKFITQRFFVAGIKDPQLGQKVVLVVEGPPSLEAGIREDITQAQLPRFHRPKTVHLVSSFEETNSGKVRRSLTLQKAAIA